MNANPVLAAKPTAPVPTAPVDYSKRRQPPEKDDVELSAAGRALLASIEESSRPKALAAGFPRIVNRMAKTWRLPREMDCYFQDLLTDTRGRRQGFPLNILMELTTLKDHYQTKVFPTRRDAPRLT